MNPTQRLEEVVTRLTPEQYARLLSFAESLAAVADSSDIELSATLQKSFPETLRQRLRELTVKSEAETLSEAERTEYIALAEQLETANAKRIEAAAKLSELKNISLTQALADLDNGAKRRG